MKINTDTENKLLVTKREMQRWEDKSGADFCGSDNKRICLQSGRPRFDFWVRKILWGREWLPTPVFLPEEFHGQRSLTDYSPWGHKKSDTTEQLTHTHVFCKSK